MPHDLSSIATPSLLLDRQILDRNISAMAAKARWLGVRLRPHIKTHKCLEIGRLQVAAGAQGITVATIVEARDFAAGGFGDITWGFPLIPSRIPEAIELARTVTLRVLVDSEFATAQLEAAARAAGIHVHTWLEVDCGYHRSGVDPAADASVALARRVAESSHLAFDGILTHAGHSYHAKDRADLVAIARQEREEMVKFAARLRAAGITVPTVSIGSTPSMSAHEDLTGIDEIRPGNYVFNDYEQVALGSSAVDGVAVSVLATVVSHQPGAEHAIVDAGALAMSKDAGPPKGGAGTPRGMGPLFAGLEAGTLDPALQLTALSQEHGFVGSAAGAQGLDGRLPVGQLVRIMPNHSCLTAAMFDEYLVVTNGRVADRWKILRGR